jgi:hypothetical protein
MAYLGGGDGKTVPELQDMVSKGLIPGGKAVEMLTAGMTKRFGGMMASMEDTWQGVTSSIKDIWRMTVGTLTQNLFGGLNAMLIKVRDFLSQFYSMLNAVMGKKAKQTTDGLVESTKGQAAAMADVGEATEKAAKKANKNLQTFDEVHQLQEDMADTAAGGMLAMPETGAEAPLGMEDAGEPETFSKMQETLEKLAVLFDPAIDGFTRLKEATEPVITSIGEGLRWFYDNILVPFGTWVIAEAVPSFMNLLSGAFTVLNPLLQAFAPLGEWLWVNFLQPIAAWTGQAFVDSINLVADALKNVGDWMSENKEIVEGITTAVLAFFAAWKLTELMAFIQMSGGLVGAINAITTAIKAGIVAKIADKAETIALTTLYAKDFIVSLAKGAASLATNTAAWIANTAAKAANTVAAWAAVAGQAALTAATTAWNVICGAATVVTTALGVAFNFLMSPITLVILAIAAVIAIVVLLIKHWDEVSAAAISAWEWIKDIWSKVSGWFDTHVIQPLVRTFNGLKTKIIGIWDGVWSGIKSVINKIIGGINTLIKGLNKIHFDIPDWVPGIGGKSFSISIPLIPKLAAGTNYIPQDMFAYLHEGEAVVPKKYNPAAGGGLTAEAIEQAVYRAFMNALRIMQTSAKQDDKELVLKIDNTVLARMQLPAIIREGQRQGLNLVVQGV